jgi:hypothetical protein
MSAPDFLDYEPSRLRLEDMLERLEVLKQFEPRRRLRTIASARARLQKGHGIGMVMLCVLGQMHEAESETTWQAEPRAVDSLVRDYRVGMSHREGMSLEAFRKLSRV